MNNLRLNHAAFRAGLIVWFADVQTGSPGSVLASYTYLGRSTVVIQDYEQPDIKLDLFGGTSGSYTGIDRFGRIVDQKWYDYVCSATISGPPAEPVV